MEILIEDENKYDDEKIGGYRLFILLERSVVEMFLCKLLVNLERGIDEYCVSLMNVLL